MCQGSYLTPFGGMIIFFAAPAKDGSGGQITNRQKFVALSSLVEGLN